jgi:hypothetical protein
MKILYFFLYLWVIFDLLDPDPDPPTQINEDPCGSGSAWILNLSSHGRFAEQFSESQPGSGASFRVTGGFLNAARELPVTGRIF